MTWPTLNLRGVPRPLSPDARRVASRQATRADKRVRLSRAAVIRSRAHRLRRSTDLPEFLREFDCSACGLFVFCLCSQVFTFLTADFAQSGGFCFSLGCQPHVTLQPTDALQIRKRALANLSARPDENFGRHLKVVIAVIVMGQLCSRHIAKNSRSWGYVIN